MNKKNKTETKKITILAKAEKLNLAGMPLSM